MRLHINLPEEINFNVVPRFVQPIGLLFLLIGLALLSYSAKTFVDGRDAQSWVLHEADISSAEVKERTSTRGRTSYSVEVRYVYSWDGRHYGGDQYRLHNHSNSRFEESNLIVKELLFAKQQGRLYPIFVDPERPEKSAVLNIVNGETQTATLILGIIFSLLGAVASLRPSLFKRKKKDLSNSMKDV